MPNSTKAPSGKQAGRGDLLERGAGLLADEGVLQAVAIQREHLRPVRLRPRRVATLERYFASSAAMPVVVDDVLIHFDDDRARAALQVFGDLATRTQVLFFTHHARLVDLARDAIPAARLKVHTLGGAPPQPVPPQRTLGIG